MKNKFSSLLLSLLLMGSLPTLAETTTEGATDEGAFVSIQMTEEELQEIKDICTAIADESGLEDEDRSESIQECIDVETMILDGSDNLEENSEDASAEDDESEEMAGDEEVSESTES